MRLRRMLAFVLTLALLLGNVTPAYAADTSVVNSISGDVTLNTDENGNIVLNNNLDETLEVLELEDEETQTPPTGEESQTPSSGEESQTPPSGEESQTPPSGEESQTPSSGDESQTSGEEDENQSPEDGNEIQDGEDEILDEEDEEGEEPELEIGAAEARTNSGDDFGFPCEFTNRDGNVVSTANTTSDTFKLVIFDINSSTNASVAVALRHIDYDEMDSENIKFLWLCQSINSTTDYDFSTQRVTFTEYLSNNQDMVDRFEVCFNYENLDSEGGSRIEDAYNAYWEAMNVSESGYTCGDVSVVYLVNGDNQVVKTYPYYHEDEYVFFDPIIEYIQQNSTCDLEAPTNVTVVEDGFEEVCIEWDYPSMEGVDGFRVYRSEDGGVSYNSDYEDDWYTNWDDDGNEDGYYMYVDAPLNQETGNNGIYTYKVVAVDKLGLQGEASVPVTNKGGSVGNDMADTEYTGIRFVDEKGTAIEQLELHVGEARKIGLAFTKADGSLVNMLTDSVLKEFHTWPDYYDKGYNFNIDWKIVFTTAEVTESNLGRVSYDSSDVDWLLTKEIVESKETYFKAKSVPTEGTKYFIEVRVTGPLNGGEIFWLRLPVSIMDAEEGKIYEQPQELTIITSQDEANQKMRDFMVERDYDSWVVTDGITEFNPTEIMDLYAERSGMKPNEGDYLYYTMGDRNSIETDITHFKRGYINYKGKNYNIDGILTPFITTAEEEKQVDAKINELVHTPGGALYNYAHGEDVSDEDKIEAIYNWITKNVSTTVPGDRRTPIYHTAYHTLIKGSGTCGAFAVLFTRLSREMGIASKVIMGLDSSAHAYNIVQLGRKWYFIDTNTKRYLSDATEFSRAQEQPHYLEDPFIINYLSKIPGNSYEIESEGIAVVTTSGQDGEQTFEDIESAVAYIVEQASLTEDEVTYTLTLRDGDMAFPLGGMVFEDEDRNFYGHRVSVNLDGYTLKIADGKNPATIGAKHVHDGFISVGDDACLRFYAGADCGDFLHENLDIVYKSTTSMVENTPMFSLMVNQGSKITLADTVKTTKFSDLFIMGDVEVNGDLNASRVELGADGDSDSTITLNGTLLSDRTLWLWGGNIDADKIVSTCETMIYDASNTTMTIGKELNISGLTTWHEEENNAKEMQVSLERYFNSAEDKMPYEYATINWSGNIHNYGIGGVTGPMLHVVAKDYVGEELQLNTAFASGSTIGTVTAKGLDHATGKYSVALTPTNYADYLTVEVENAEKNFVDIEANVLSVVSLSVIVTGTSTGKTASFSSLKKAIDELADVANKTVGEYTFALTENAALSSNVTLPDYVKNAVFKVADTVEADVTIDFKGYSLTTKGAISIEEGIKLVSSTINSGKLVSTKSTDAPSYSIKLKGDVSKVNLSATSGTLLLEGTESETRKIEGDISAKEVQVNDAWEVEGTITNSGLRNKGTLICNAITQGTSNKTYLEADSLLVINKKATLYNVTCDESVMEGQPSMYRTKNAEVSFNGTFASQGKKLRFAVLAANDAEVDGMYDTFVDFAAREALFTTGIKVFPVESVQLVQNSQTPKYTSLMQVNDKVLVVGEWIVLKAKGVDGKEEVIKRFTNWKEASTYINNLSNASMTYVVEITDHLDLEEALTMPTKAAGIIFRGVSEGDEIIELKYTGDLKLSTNTTFENIDLGAEKLNTTTKQYDPYLSAANLAGKSLTLLNSDAEFVSVTGTNTSILRVEGDGNLVTVSKAVKTLNALEVIGATVEIGSALKLTEAAISSVKDIALDDAAVLVKSGTVAMTGILFMENAILDANSKIEVVDIISNSDSNRILYGGNATSNILTVKGNVTAGSDMVEDNVLPFRKAAIDITVKSLEEKNGYVQDAILLNAQKAPATWFVVGSMFAENGIRTDATHLTHKKGTVIKCGKVAASVAELYVYDEEGRSYSLCDSYATLQEAFDEIDRIGNSSQSYKIILTKDSILTGDYKFPSKAAALLISSKEGSQYTIGFKSKADIKCNTVFNTVFIKASEKNGTLAINGNRVTIMESQLSENIAVTGNGTAKGSQLTVTGNEYVRVASIKNVDALSINTLVLYVTGETNVGDVLFEKGGSLCGQKAIKTINVNCSGKGTIITFPTVSATEVKPSLEITGELQVENVDTNGYAATGKLKVKFGKTLKFVENQNGVTSAELVIYDGIDFSDEIIEKNKVVLAKAPKVSTQDVEFVQRTVENPGYLYKKSGNIVYKKSAPTVVLSYYNDSYDDDVNAAKVFETECETFADAVAEIDNLKTKRDYKICFLPADGSVAAELKMPKNSSVNTLTLTSCVPNSDDINDVFYLKNINFTSDVVLEDISFVQMVQDTDANGKTIVGQYNPITSVNRYPAAVNVKTSGNELVMSGDVTFNTPIALEGGNKAVLTIAEDANVQALADNMPGAGTNIQGNITKFKEVNINNYFSMEGPQLSVNSYGTCTMDVTTLKVGASGEVYVGSLGDKDTLKAKDVILEGGDIIVNGNAQLTNVTLAENSPVLDVLGQTFTITGVLTSTANKGTLVTTVDKNGKSVLNISGTAVLGDDKENRIVVSVVDEDGKAIQLNGNTLLKASKIKANVFQVHDASTPGGNTKEYSLRDATNGYFLKKNKEYVEVYCSDNIVAALCKTEEIPQSSDEEIPVINYFATLEEAIAEIKALNQVTQEYTVMLLKDVGTSQAFSKMTVPEKAAKVTFTKPANLDDSIELYIEASLTQKTDLAFENITVVNKKNWDTKNFDLVLKNADVTVQDKATATKLTLVDGSSLKVEKAVTITDIVNQNAVGGTNNEVICTQPAGLTIKGYVTDIDHNGQPTENVAEFPRVILDAAGQATLLEESGTPIKQKDIIVGEQYNLFKTKKLAMLEKETMDSFVFQNGGDGVNAVWASKGIYQVEDDYEYAVDVVTLEILNQEEGSYNEEATTQCLDESEAANYINTVSQKTNGYYVKLEEQTADTKVTDAKAVSEFVMPAKDKAGIVIFKPKNREAGQANISFTGDVKANGNVRFEKVEFDNSNVFSISMLKGPYTLELHDISTDKIKSITDVASLRLVNSNITTQATSKVDNLILEKNAIWNCYGTTTIGSVALKLDESSVSGKTYLSSYYSTDRDGKSTGIPQLTINGNITGGKLPVMIYDFATKDDISNYSDAKLVLAKTESADKFVAFDYAQFNSGTFEYEYTNADITPYKDKSGYVSNGSILDKQVILEQQDKNGGWTQSYVKTYAEAIDIINNSGSKTDVYKITLRGNAESVEVGTLPLPKKDKAKQFIIAGNGKNDADEDVSRRTLIFKGAIQPKCNLSFENVILQEVDSNNKIVNGITLKTDVYNVNFGANVKVATDNTFKESANLVFNTIDGSKGSVTFGTDSIYVAGEIKLKELAVAGNANILSKGKITITDVLYTNVIAEAGVVLTLTGEKEIVITNVLSENDNNRLEITTYYKNKSFSKSETQLTVSGEVDKDVAVVVKPWIYDKDNGTPRAITKTDMGALRLSVDKTPQKFQKVITAAKMIASEDVTVWCLNEQGQWTDSGLRAIKHEGGIYFTDADSGIEVVGYQAENDMEVYRAEFFTWEQAVKEIDKLNHAEWKYVINVLKDQGCGTPLKSVTMPAKAKEVVIDGANHTGILTTSNKITLKCETEFKDISLCAVKKGDSYYSIPLTLDSGKFDMDLNGVNSQCEYDGMGWFTSDISINGAAQSTIEVDVKDGSYYDLISKITNAGKVILNPGMADGDESSCYYVISDGIKGVKQLELLAGAMVNSGNSEVSVTDLTIGEATGILEEGLGDRAQIANGLRSGLNAKNITVSGTTYMASCDLTAGTTTVGDGKITLTNVVFRDNYNLMEGKLDKNGKTSINIKGNVVYDTEYPVSQNSTALSVGLYLNNSISTYATLTEGMSLLTAPKAATSMLVPYYAWTDDMSIVHQCMGSNIEGWGLYKSGNDIKYGKLTQNEVRVHVGTNNAEDIGSVPTMEFATYEEAIKAIDTMAIYKQDGSKLFEEYTMELLSDVMIGNDKGDGKYAALTLPSKASQFTILGTGHSIEFSGNVSLKCNTTLRNVQMLSMKSVKGVATPTTMNITVGNYTLTNSYATLGYYEGNTFVSGVNNMTGSAKGYLVIDQDSYLEVNSLSGMNLQFVGNGENILYKQDGNENSGVKTGTIWAKGNLSAKQLMFSDYAGGHLKVNGNLVLDAINTVGDVYAELTICSNKPMQIKGMTQTIGDNKVTDSVFLLENDGEVLEALILNVKSTTKQEVPSGTKVITGKYLKKEYWNVRTVLGEDVSAMKSLYYNGADLYLGSVKYGG